MKPIKLIEDENWFNIVKVCYSDDIWNRTEDVKFNTREMREMIDDNIRDFILGTLYLTYAESYGKVNKE